MISRFTSLDLSKLEKIRTKNAIASISLMMLLVLSLSPYYISGLKPANAQVNSPVCKELLIAKVAANGARGAETALLAVDNDIKTRWANDGKGSFIQLDLGQSEAICNIDIAWCTGHEKSYNFVISTSEDGKTFRDTASARSTGQTSSPERYNIPDQTARYVRITVNGNTDDDLGSINEMSVRGRVSAEQQTCTIPKITG
ncbi:MAG: discoidin domain-containing protein, partial [Nitrososphaeraceae archaeon]